MFIPFIKSPDMSRSTLTKLYSARSFSMYDHAGSKQRHSGHQGAENSITVFPVLTTSANFSLFTDMSFFIIFSSNTKRIMPSKDMIPYLLLYSTGTDAFQDTTNKLLRQQQQSICLMVSWKICINKLLSIIII